MRYIFVMSLAGSLMFVCYLIACAGKGKMFSAGTKDLLLKSALFFFLVPLFFLSELYQRILYYLPDVLWKGQGGIRRVPYYFSRTDGGIRLGSLYGKQLYVFALWLTVAVGIFLVRVCRYTAQKRDFLAHSRRITEEKSTELLEKIKKEYGIKRKVQLYDSGTIAFTMGVFRPVICFDSSLTVEEQSLLLRHECAHIKRLDVLTKQLADIVVCFHWFNPLVYLLPGYMERNCEICCDEKTVKGMKPEQRAAYAGLLLQNMERTAPPARICTALSQNGKKAEERILAIMCPVGRSTGRKVLAALFVVMLGFLDTFTALAYPNAVEIELNPGEEFDPDAEISFVEESEKELLPMADPMLLYGVQFVDPEGNIYRVDENAPDMNAGHEHCWVEGIQQEHEVIEGEADIVYGYACRRCSVCNMTVTGEQLYVYTRPLDNEDD